MPKKDIILSSSSQWASPIMLVPSNKEMHKGTLGDHGGEKTPPGLGKDYIGQGITSRQQIIARLIYNFARGRHLLQMVLFPHRTSKLGFPMQLVAVDIIGPFHA